MTKFHLKMTENDHDRKWPLSPIMLNATTGHFKLLLQETCKNSIYLKYNISATYVIFTILFP